MGFYIAFNNISSFLKMSQFTGSTEENQSRIDDSIEDIIKAVVTNSKINILPEAGDLSENPPFVTDYSEANLVSVVQDSPVIESTNKTSATSEKEKNLKVETQNLNQSDNYEIFQSLLKKFEISLQYRYDLTDVFTTNRQRTNSQNLDKLIEKNLNKKRVAQQEDFEKRSQQKQAENFKEHLKQKRFTSQLQNNSK